MLDELDEEGAWGGSDGSSITLSDRDENGEVRVEGDDGDENGEVRVEGDCVPTEDLFVQFAASGDIDGLRLLLAETSTVDASAEVPNGHEALMEAAKAGHAACVQALLNAGVVVDATVWAPFPHACSLDETSITRALIEAGVAGALENDHKSVLKILLRAGVALDTSLARRRSSNVAAWTLVDLIRKLGSWDEYVRRHRVVLLSLIAKMADGALIPDVLKYAIADYVSPPGGN